MTGRVRWRGLVAVLVTSLTVLAGCSTGADANTHGGTFEFVSPGGKTEIFYDPPSDRGTIGNLHGPALMDESDSAGADEGDAPQISLSDFDGQVVVINLWGSWCGPCRGEVPDLQKVYQATKASGVEILGIDVRDFNKDEAQRFFRRNDVTYPSIYDPDMRAVGALGNFPTSVIPSTLVLDRHHRVAAVFLKALTTARLQPVVERVAAGKPAEA